jgi:hypothetical protein
LCVVVSFYAHCLNFFIGVKRFEQNLQVMAIRFWNRPTNRVEKNRIGPRTRPHPRGGTRAEGFSPIVTLSHIAWPVPSAKIQIETIGFLLLPRGTTQHTCSTRRALFSLGNSLEKGRERRQQHVRPVDGGCRGSSRKQHRDISVFLTSESVGPAGLSQQSGCLSSQEILPRVVTIHALALLTLSRPQSSESAPSRLQLGRAKSSESVFLQAPARLTLTRAKSSESVTLPAPARFPAPPCRLQSSELVTLQVPARLTLSRAKSSE